MQYTDRKQFPVVSGLLSYFPDALLAVASVSMEGARKHDTFNAAGEPTWDRSKSADDLDALGRHLVDNSKVSFDTDGHLHMAKVAWRALAHLQKMLDSPSGGGATGAQADTGDYMELGWDLGDTADSRATIVVTPATAAGFSNATTVSIYGDADVPISAYTVARLLGLPVDNVIDMRGLEPQPRKPKITINRDAHAATMASARLATRRETIEQFATFLNTRDECVHLGSKHGLTGPREIANAIAEYFGDDAGSARG